MKQLTYFVPVDFSNCSYNALHYAAMLARFSGGKIRISHVIDLEELAETENPVVLQWNLDQLNRKAEQKMSSIREIIALENIPVEDEIVMGNVRFQLMKQIENLKPDIIVLGSDHNEQPQAGSIISFISKQTTIPVLVVPGNHNPRLPNRAILATDMKPERIAELDSIMQLVNETSQEVAILPIKGRYSSNSDYAKEWVNKLNKEYGIQSRILFPGESADSLILTEIVRKNQVDLIFTIKRKSLVARLLNGSTSTDWITQAGVPVLVISS
ncbi:MAG: universal stress protein [Cyclobacteriaceae bacterium]|nr:universal stress protein [Cyclobacteriaceae bacterium]